VALRGVVEDLSGLRSVQTSLYKHIKNMLKMIMALFKKMTNSDNLLWLLKQIYNFKQNFSPNFTSYF
jgi:hypothetical protein